MVITKREDVTKQGFCKILWRKLRLRGSLLLELIQSLGGGRGEVGGVGVGALLSLSGIGREVGWGERLFEAGRLLTFSAFWMGAYSRLGAYSNKYGIYGHSLQCSLKWPLMKELQVIQTFLSIDLTRLAIF